MEENVRLTLQYSSDWSKTPKRSVKNKLIPSALVNNQLRASAGTPPEPELLPPNYLILKSAQIK